MALEGILRLLDRNQIRRDSVTLVFDKGTAALANTALLALARPGLDFRSLLEPGAGRVPPAPGGRAARFEERTARPAGRGREPSGSWFRNISVS